MRFVNIRSLANSTKSYSSVWGTVLLPLLLLTFSQDGITQETAAALKAQKVAETLNVPYLTDKGAMEKLSKAPLGFITKVSTAQEGPQLVVSVDTNCKPAYQEFSLGSPSRLVVDFLNVENRAPVLNYPIGAAGVRQLRVRQFQSSSPKIARLVFDLDKGYGRHEVAANDKGVRITFHPGESANPGVPKTPPPAAGAPKQQAAPAPDRDNKKTEAPPAAVPVISDLAVSEIPQVLSPRRRPPRPCVWRRLR